jgi:aryl-alcohol dehydrogenase-like predicted oxidoreductase
MVCLRRNREQARQSRLEKRGEPRHVTPNTSIATDRILMPGPLQDVSASDRPVACALRRLGSTGLVVSSIGFGAFKIGRNEKTKYPAAYDLPSDPDVDRLLGGLLDLGINYIDTAPAYGASEERIGRFLASRRRELILATKVGETFAGGASRFDFSSEGLRASVERSLGRLRTDMIDVLLLHSDGRDLWIQNETDAVDVLRELKGRGLVRAIGLSGKTVEGARQALSWADVLMVEYHIEDRSHESVIRQAAEREVGVLVKKGLASGHLPAEEAVRFVLANPHVASLVVGGLNLAHFRHNIKTASEPQKSKRD